MVDVRSVVLDQGGKVEAGRQLANLGQRIFIVGLGGVAAFRFCPVDPGDPGLEIENGLGPRGRVWLPGKGQHIGQMLEIFAPRLRLLGVLRQIIIAVGHAEPALGHIHRILIGRLAVLADEHREWDVDSEPIRFRIQRGEIPLRFDGADLVEPRRDRRNAFRLDCRLVHEARIGRANSAVGVLRLLVDDLARALSRQIVEDVERAVAGLVGRDRRVLRPSAVGILIEIVPGHDARIHAGKVEAKRAILRLGRRRRLGHNRDSFGGSRNHGGRRCRRLGTAGKRRRSGQERDHPNHSITPPMSCFCSHDPHASGHRSPAPIDDRAVKDCERRRQRSRTLCRARLAAAAPLAFEP